MNTATIRPAATVVMLRDTIAHVSGLQVWLQRRASVLAFAADMHVFPGGRVDDHEDTSSVQHDLAQQATVWGDLSTHTTARHLAAAVRETWEESGVRLPPEGLIPWARWVTPPGESRRFDARFYLAACPVDQQPRPLTGEVADGQWYLVREAVAMHQAGDLAMWPPTIDTLMSLLPFADIASALKAAPHRVEAVNG